MSRVFKIFWKNEVRRFSAPNLTWNGFLEYVRSILGSEFHPELRFQYVDDENDKVELSTQYEWDACLAQVPPSGLVKLYISQTEDGIYFKDSPGPRVQYCYLNMPESRETEAEAIAPEIKAVLASNVPKLLGSFFPDNKILPHNIPDWLIDAILVKDIGPHDVELDVNIPAFYDALFSRSIKLMATDLNLAEQTWLKAFETAQVIKMNPRCVLYNIACTKALLGNKAGAIDYLRKAIENGYDGFLHAMEDPDLESIRGEPEFAVLITQRIPKAQVTVPMEEAVESAMDTLNITEEPKVEETPQRKEATQYTKELADLRAMGFSQDDNTMMVLLAAYNGAVDGVISHLFAQE